MTPAHLSESALAVELANTVEKSPHVHALLRLLLGPIVGALIWFLPLGIDAAAQKPLAIVLFMIIYWITEPVDHAVTALVGCYLFWALEVVDFPVAFSGFASSTPWFLFGAMLMGEAASRTGLAKRFGFLLLRRTGMTYPRLLFGVISLSFLLNFFIPNGTARVTVIAPILIGIMAVFHLSKQSNIAKGLFLILSYTTVLFDKMILSGASAFLTRGIIEEQTGVQIFWGEWFLAYLPAALITILACWLTIQWLYPPEKKELPEGRDYLLESLKNLGRLSGDERKVLAVILVAMALWATDFIHQTNPAVIGIGAGLFLALPQVGVLDTKAVKQVNFLIIAFSAGALSMGNVLAQTKALTALTSTLVEYIEPLLSNSFYAAITLYWGGISYHLLLANNLSMLSTSLPLLLQMTADKGFNPAALGLIWSFAGGGNLFVYQSSVLLLGYSYGYFTGKDLLKLGLVLTFIEACLLMVLVPLYWPLIGLSWQR